MRNKQRQDMDAEIERQRAASARRAKKRNAVDAEGRKLVDALKATPEYQTYQNIMERAERAAEAIKLTAEYEAIQEFMTRNPNANIGEDL